MPRLFSQKSLQGLLLGGGVACMALAAYLWWSDQGASAAVAIQAPGHLTAVAGQASVCDLTVENRSDRPSKLVGWEFC